MTGFPWQISGSMVILERRLVAGAAVEVILMSYGLWRRVSIRLWRASASGDALLEQHLEEQQGEKGDEERLPEFAAVAAGAVE